MTEVKVININNPFQDQKPGTSGLRKSTLRFEEDHYLEIFIEAILKSLKDLKGSTLIVGGDGRYGNIKAIKKIIQICVAHEVGKVIIPKNGLLSTPATSHLIRKEGAIGGIILSASHNPGGIDGDFGVKLNTANGGPAPESITNQIFQCSQSLKSYKISNIKIPDLDNFGVFSYGETSLEIIDGLKDYSDLMENIFDLDQISDFLKNDFSFIFDAMNAVTGPYAKNIFVEKMGLVDSCVMNGIPLEDFGGLHPDPNLTYASKLADLLLVQKAYSFGAACDGDGDRNMILGKGCFVNPSDSLAVITANTNCVPGYKDGIAGVARSMPTSSAVDSVARVLNIPCFETPTGWKFFGNLLDSNSITICGEESFGTGSNHVREKDGLWAVLYWLQILAVKNCSVSELIQNHWKQYGRNYYSRHDYEAIPSTIANQIFNNLSSMLPSLKDNKFAGNLVKQADNFSYLDPVDNTISKNQGLRIILEDNSRVIIRLSGTGTKGSTLRLYFEKFASSQHNLDLNPQIALKDLINDLDHLLNISKLTKMEKPTVIT
ncbi:alpha-D-glucose phosphate-specific phosphoglucomutase [Prochlorococcus sp. AH-716-O05]|nr:alpha-D-glucose phosphate-specific phosphoglucomutase [Prochlorococcus sp. AH-716-O05]